MSAPSNANVTPLFSEQPIFQALRRTEELPDFNKSPGRPCRNVSQVAGAGSATTGRFLASDVRGVRQRGRLAREGFESRGRGRRCRTRTDAARARCPMAKKRLIFCQIGYGAHHGECNENERLFFQGLAPSQVRRFCVRTSGPYGRLPGEKCEPPRLANLLQSGG